ncbi:Flp family type IVb pilin [Caulobacter sp. 17J65-9]|uniref:Flp family type IVb pilin n=1 Tax=Caulobacter sp. 17J65-9 TaxID=2709382 RepID=UPI0013C91B9D|nr:Flp family type IVb pilin [Caulobacter sp. 17J65-9]NEX94994.1 Flp family type IVb pilin [Caulobacter sp. 17J65-9]
MLLKAYVKATAVAADAKAYLQRLRDDESGASMVEYSLLIGLITVAAVLMISAVGGKVSTAWTNLNTNFTVAS